MLTVRLAVASAPVLNTDVGENTKVLGGSTPGQPAPVVAAESAAVQLGFEELNVPLNWIVSGKDTEAPARPEVGLCAPKSTLLGCPSVNVVWACRPELCPFAVSTNRTSIS